MHSLPCLGEIGNRVHRANKIENDWGLGFDAEAWEKLRVKLRTLTLSA